MAFEYYLYSYLWHFPSTNIFEFSFVDSWTTEYIQLFICKFLKIWKYLNICSEPYSNICMPIFNKNSFYWYNLCIKNIQCKILFTGSMSEPFKKNLISVEYEYLNKISLQYYLYSYMCYLQSTNIFGYSFSKYVASEYIQIFVRYIMWHPNIFGYWL